MQFSIGVIGFEHVGKSTIINGFIGDNLSKSNTTHESYFNIGNFESYTEFSQIESNITNYIQNDLQFPESFQLSKQYNYTFIDIPGINHKQISKDKHFKYLKSNINDVDALFVVLDISQFDEQKTNNASLLEEISKLNVDSNSFLVNVIFNKCDSLIGIDELTGEYIFDNEEEEAKVDKAFAFIGKYGYNKPLLLNAKKTLLISAGNNGKLVDKEKAKYDLLIKQTSNDHLFDTVGFSSLINEIKNFIETNKSILNNKHILHNLKLEEQPNLSYLQTKLKEISPETPNDTYYNSIKDSIVSLTKSYIDSFVKNIDQLDNINELEQSFNEFSKEFNKVFSIDIDSDKYFNSTFRSLEFKYHANQLKNGFDKEAFKYLYQNNYVDKLNNLFVHSLQNNLTDDNIIDTINFVVETTNNNPNYVYTVINAYISNAKKNDPTYYNAFISTFNKVYKGDSIYMNYIGSKLSINHQFNDSDYDFAMFSKAKGMSDVIRVRINSIKFNETNTEYSDKSEIKKAEQVGI